ncbi:hypothetical protein P43SY_011244 [Pythium insidiosum]|uniref:Chitin-binding type-4 domain-containing protein n=1 Tax=Pythium insidiosum TaxID=114742 RepID=A0AAD5L643_PYTIN|nr:hypothetical protein P43SY_011244 [Pythium insidiosum]
MLRSTIAALATALAVLTLPTTIEAHGSMSNPMPKFKDIYNLDAPSASMPGPAGPYKGNDELKALAEKAGSRCGQTDPNHVQPIPTNGALQFKITAVHIGPCEVWLGNTKVASARDCWKEFTGFRIPVDFSKCGSSCQLRWVWLATHNSPWEFYDNCVQLGGGNGGNGGNNNNGGGNSTTPTRAPLPVPTRAPAPAPVPVPTQAPLPTQAPANPKPTQKPQPTSQPEPAPQPKPEPEPKPEPQPTDAPATVRPPSGGDGKCFKGKDDARLDSWCMDNCAMGFCPVSHCKAC